MKKKKKGSNRRVYCEHTVLGVKYVSSLKKVCQFNESFEKNHDAANKSPHDAKYSVSELYNRYVSHKNSRAVSCSEGNSVFHTAETQPRHQRANSSLMDIDALLLYQDDCFNINITKRCSQN